MPTQRGTIAQTAVIPVLVYQDIEAAHDFLVGTFGFTSGGLHRSEDGTVIHGEVRWEDAAIWLHAVTEERQLASPRGSTRSYGGLEVIVDDVDAHYARSQAAGAHIDRAPRDQPYGLREYSARDPENHRWWFSSPRPERT
jgi:MerR family transcriptional regulator, thiopeptide resistance regulator